MELHPELLSKVEQLKVLAEAEGIKVAMTSGARGFARQALLYSTFRRSPQEALEKYGVVHQPAPMGATRHHPFFDGKAVACDLSVASHPREMPRLRAQARLGELAEEVGLVWGGRWANPDRVHFELASVGGERFDIWDQYVKLGEKLDRMAGIL